jgi:CubicO group peptidase (beta-lactamase class C family)
MLVAWCTLGTLSAAAQESTPASIPVSTQTPSAPATLAGEWRDDIDAFVARVVDAGLVPGLSVAVSQDDWVLYSAGYGSADLASGRRVGEETRFYIASSTKALTATAVVLLAHRGELALDAPVTRYLPSLRLTPPLDASTIRLRDLLTLSHGIDDEGSVVFRTAYTGDFTPELLIELLADHKPAKSGRAFKYGNLGYNILGLVLEATGEGSWKEIVAREVLEPLGMRQTTAYVSRLDTQQIALPHRFEPDGRFRRVPLGKADENMHAAGGHFATAGDLARSSPSTQAGAGWPGGRCFPANPSNGATSCTWSRTSTGGRSTASVGASAGTSAPGRTRRCSTASVPSPATARTCRSCRSKASASWCWSTASARPSTPST